MDVPQESNSNWRLWCRLCAKDDIQNNINVFMKHELPSDEASPTAKREVPGMGIVRGDLTLATAIGKYFWINITRGEELPEMICTECLTLVTSLVNFSQRITRVQKLFCILQSTPRQEELDINGLRGKFGLLDDHEPMLMAIPREALTEVHYVEEKPTINEHGLLEETMELKNPLTPCLQNVDEQEEKSTIILNNTSAGNEDEVDADALLELCDVYAVTGDYDDDTDAVADDDHHNELNNDNDDMLSVNSARSSKTSSSPQPAKVKQKRRLLKRNKNCLQDSKSYKCTECMRAYSRATTLQRHMRQEHAKTPADVAAASKKLPCLECDKMFRTPYQLERHMQRHLPNRKVYPCSSCDKKFISSASVQSHVQYMHLNERPRLIMCEQCGVSVHTKSALEEHMLTHTDYAPYECDICKKCFKSASRLKLHKETHDPRKYICPECGMQLNSRPTLNRHRLVHTDQMQHKCDYCGREFKRAKALKNHLILHTGLKPYSCDFCDRTFANGSNCRTHKKKAHPEELAAQEAAGGAKSYNRNIPKLEALKAFTKNKDNLSPVATKQSGCFAFGKKPKPAKKIPTNEVAETMPTEAAAPGIPTIDNIYNHIMKQPSLSESKPTLSNVAFVPQHHVIVSPDGSITTLQAAPLSATSSVNSHASQEEHSTVTVVTQSQSQAQPQVFSY